VGCSESPPQQSPAPLSATGDLISRFEAAAPHTRALASVRDDAIAAWQRNFGRTQNHRDRLLHVSTSRGLRRVFNRAPTSANERDATTIVADLRRLGGPACDLDRAIADPPLTIPLPDGTRVRPPALRVPPPPAGGGSTGGGAIIEG
jgi:hypothetical protein